MSKILKIILISFLSYGFVCCDETIIPKELFDLSQVPPLLTDLVENEQQIKEKEDRAMVQDVVSKIVKSSDKELEAEAKILAKDKNKFQKFLTHLPQALAIEHSKKEELLFDGEIRKNLEKQFDEKELAVKLSISLKNTKISDLIMLASKLTKLNFVVDPDIDVMVPSLDLKDVSLASFLKILFSFSKEELVLTKEMNVYRVAKLSNIYESLKRKILGAKSEEFERYFITLNNVKFTDEVKIYIENVWKSLLGEDFGKTGFYLICDKLSKKILFRGRVHQVGEMKSFLKGIDVFLPQVKIEVRMVIANKDFEESLGVRWSGIYNRRASMGSGWGFIGGGNPSEGIKNAPAAQSAADVVDWALNFFPAAGDAGRMIKLPFVFGGKDLNTKRLNLELDAAETKGDVKTILKPSILTNHGEDAEILVGSSIPIEAVVKDTIADSLRDITTATYKDVGTKLKVKPLVSADKKSIFLDIYVENSSASQAAGAKYPTIATTRSSSRVALKSGQTTMIGGLIEDTKNDYKAGIPLISNIPLFGYLFKGTRKNIKDHQLLIFITPSVS
ncbi:TPA: hypothetical protein DEO28_00035 [Candidatus Dependentiae bacterium]|nr:MAG: Type IV pilus secretin PilQ [candidate division TM6 bacterium GW2011_GWE2_31_21]KKP53986.1 MAG: Type IV pilus secretin PilQ [candidate division TM6 bacterium GW2011_GWF2_33_332]HBS48433.1 hypothetical protein [Candidatus Dependentiae bacterium]HBZ72893.1 hypothetical protein [Candidatus Dependentiae bacterium]